MAMNVFDELIELGKTEQEQENAPQNVNLEDLKPIEDWEPEEPLIL